MNGQTAEKPTAAFVLSLLAGLWMLGMGGGWGMGMVGMMGPEGSAEPVPGGWMWGHGLLGPGWAWLGLAAGIVVLIGAVTLYSRPESAPTWGLVILVVSALNLLVGMGGLLGSTLGIVGGALAMSARPRD